MNPADAEVLLVFKDLACTAGKGRALMRISFVQWLLHCEQELWSAALSFVAEKC